MLRKGFEYYIAKPKEKKYMLSGIPYRYLKAEVDQINFLTFSQERPYHKKNNLTISKATQKECFDKLLTKEGLGESAVIGIASAPTDDLAMAAGSILAKKALDFGYSMEMVDIGNPPGENLSKVPDVLVLHNITIDSDYKRFMLCRDWILWGTDCLRIVILGGSNPIDFFDNKIRFPLDLSFYLEGSYNPYKRVLK